MKLDFSGQTVLVTGATRGIGRRMAQDFRDLGARVLLTGTKPEQVAELNAAAESDIRYLAADFTRPESTRALLAELETEPRIDVCVNNAGINRINPIGEVRTEDWRDVLEVNLTAPFMLTRALAPRMREQGYGRIVNIGSIFGHVSRAQRSVYTTTKYGLRGLTITASIELAPHGVLVNTVSPGFVLTDLTREILSDEERAALEAEIPAGRFADPSDISRVVIFLSSSLNTYLTGQNIIVDGGFVNV